MSVKKGKRMSRKIKRTIRKTVAGLCLVSALVVALVPAEVTRAYTSPTVENSYAYGVTEADYINMATGGVDLGAYNKATGESSETIYQVLNVNQLSDGSYSVGWQFKMYLTKVSGTNFGVICDYNSTYSAEEVSIQPFMPYAYMVVENATFSSFKTAYENAKSLKGSAVNAEPNPASNDFSKSITAAVPLQSGSTKNLQAVYIINEINEGYNSQPNKDNYWINKYFPSQYASYKNQYDAYLEQLAAFNTYKAWELNDGNIATRPPITEDPGNPPVLKCWVSEMSDDSIKKYFCEVHPDYKDDLNSDDYTLVEVADTRNSSGSGGVTVSYCYMPKGTPGNNKNDVLGFYIKDKCQIIAIGEGAFKGIKNVQRLKLCDEIKYIGDEAFSDSFVRSVAFSNVENIGNRAFYECSQLAEISFTRGLTSIGAEAFYGCGMSSVSLPSFVKVIGPGAFAECRKLSSVDLSEISQQETEIKAFAFYNDVALSNISFSNSINKIGEAAFACSKGVTGGLTSITLPDNISENGAIGNFLFAGRTNLQYVTMPSDFGKGSNVTLPFGVFYNCVGLKCVEFPDDGGGSCGLVSFGKSADGKRTIFDTVTTPDFYVKGPSTNMLGDFAGPRRSTWGLKTALGNEIPFVYLDANGEEHFEVSNGEYLLLIDDDGVLQSCELVNKVTEIDELTIPSKVGNTPVKSVAAGCFSEEVKEKIKVLTIKDNSISEIDAGAFKNCENLERVNIGNTVTKIGASAFEGCKNLTYVNFETPRDGYASLPLENIGENAFSTGSKSLIFEGDIDLQYGPFIWATDKDNYVDKDQGIRVCYKTGFPYYLTVIVDNRNLLPTLVDYPHYEQVDDYLVKYMEENPSYVGQGKTTTLEFSDGPRDIDTRLTTRYEHLGEEITDVSDNDSTVILYTYSMSLAEEQLLNGTMNIVVPSGVESIDVKGYLTNTSELAEGVPSTATNTKNATLYCQSFEYYPTYKLEGLFSGYFGKFENGKREYPDGNSLEKENQGNDRVLSISMNSVDYLPDGAFYSCENLSSIVLGANLNKLGESPFAGCEKLTSIGSTTSAFTCYNGIIYSTNPDGTYNIVEVLSSRGKLVGNTKIKVGADDPYLSNVSSICDGAFKNCTGITGVDLTGMDLLTNIPDEAFRGCSKLNQVICPPNITSIGHNSFAGCTEGIELVVYGEEVFMAYDTFGEKTKPDYVTSKRVKSYRNSAARRAAADIGCDVSEVLDETVKVQFVDYDGTEISKVIYVVEGDSIALEDIPQDPVRAGYTFAGWNKPLTNITEDTLIVATYTQNPVEKPDDPGKDDPGTNDPGTNNPGSNDPGNNDPGNNNPGSNDPGNNDPGTNDPGNNNNNNNSNNNGNTDNGNGNNTNNNGNNNQTTAPKMYTLTVTNGNGSGSYAEGATVIITCTNPPTGKVFDKWVPATTDLGIASVNVAATTLVMPAHEASVTATYKDAPVGTSSTGSTSSTSGSNNNGSNSGGTANNNGNSVIISKPGVSNSGLASATVSGSSDNYVVRISENANATAAVEKALTNEYGSLENIRYSAMDINLYDSTGTNRITDYSGLSITITMPIPDTMTQYAGNNKVAAVSNEKLEKLNPKFTSIDGVPCITFTATHFSPYVIYADTQNLILGVNDSTPQTGDGIRPKWFLVFGLATLGIALLFIKDKKPLPKVKVA